MKISARNQFEGIVKEINEGAVNAEVLIELADGLVIASIITMSAVKNIGLEVGKPATAIIKASNVMVGA
ncbi:TOBE domain-containing protein [Vibrio porteresiae]|uniref:TOBE domain-containing protein n=1 Tax=Vibrio porteresiae DSM 19223 TaxID=1123496 RepID=A0ABZ0Q8H1_9VIBR|nr:TOBE domain-containing protein [Vibrio porteresiae]WPC72306.1 TOBE domain-containing protein [Vibrio porteresiae DSM 19223]